MTKAKPQLTPNHSDWAKLHVFPTYMHIVWASGLRVHDVLMARYWNKHALAQSAIVNAKTFQYSQVVHSRVKTVALSLQSSSTPCTNSDTRLGCCWWQSGKALEMQGSGAKLIITTVKAQMIPRRAGWNRWVTKVKSNTKHKHTQFGLLHFKNKVSHPRWHYKHEHWVCAAYPKFHPPL